MFKCYNTLNKYISNETSKKNGTVRGDCIACDALLKYVLSKHYYLIYPETALIQCIVSIPIKCQSNVNADQATCRYLKLGDILFRFSGFREKFKLGFTFVYIFYTFKLLPQLIIGRRLSL